MQTGVFAGGLAGAIVLVVAEFTALYAIHTVGKSAAVRTVTTGSHQDSALLPMAVLAGIFTIAARRGAGRPALLAVGALGVIALLVALVGDLPDAHATGLIALAGGGYEVGKASPTTGFYLETLGAIILVISSGVGLLMGVRAPAPRRA